MSTETAQTTFKITIGLFDVEFALVKTNTPKAYDYGYCIDVYTYSCNNERFVLVPVNSLDYQMGRYLSGGFAKVEDLSQSLIEWITGMLYGRISHSSN